MTIRILRRELFCGVGAAVLSVMLYHGATGAAAAEAGNPFETIPPNEAAEIAELSQLATKLQDKRLGEGDGLEREPVRGVHPKSHGCVRAQFTVAADLAEDRRVGLFATPGKTYDAWIRYSNAAVLREDDLKAADPTKPDERKNSSRGMAIKVLDVEGEMLSEDNGHANQDFLMINTPEFAIANVRDYLRLNRVLMLSERGDVAAPFFLPLTGASPPPGALADIFKDFDDDDRARTGKSLGLITEKIEKQTVRNPLEVQYFGAAPFGFGPERAMKFSAAPCGEPREQAPFKPIVAGDPSRDYLREALVKTMQGEEDVCFNFMIQLAGVDKVADLGIEDATTTWELDHEPVALITIPAPQDPEANERDQCEAMAFSPWHSLAAHRPLGGINRLRQQVYIESAKHREAQGYH